MYVEVFYPLGSYDAAVAATVNAIKFIKLNAANWDNANPARIFYSGASAGGGNAMRAAMIEPVWRVGGYSPAGLSIEGAPVPANPTAQIYSRVIGPQNTWAAHMAAAFLRRAGDDGFPMLVGQLFHGKLDTQIPLAHVQAFTNHAKTLGHDIGLHVQQKGGHMDPCPPQWQVTKDELTKLVHES